MNDLSECLYEDSLYREWRSQDRMDIRCRGLISKKGFIIKIIRRWDFDSWKLLRIGYFNNRGLYLAVFPFDYWIEEYEYYSVNDPQLVEI